MGQRDAGRADLPGLLRSRPGRWIAGELMSTEYQDRATGQNPIMLRPVWVPHDGGPLYGTVLWEYVDTGRARALVRYELPGGLVVRRLHWSDELCAAGRTIELDLRLACVVEGSVA